MQKAWRENVTVRILISKIYAGAMCYTNIFSCLQTTDNFCVSVQGVCDHELPSDNSDNRALPMNQAMRKELAGEFLSRPSHEVLSRPCRQSARAASVRQL